MYVPGFESPRCRILVWWPAISMRLPSIPQNTWITSSCLDYMLCACASHTAQQVSTLWWLEVTVLEYQWFERGIIYNIEPRQKWWLSTCLSQQCPNCTLLDQWSAISRRTKFGAAFIWWSLFVRTSTLTKSERRHLSNDIAGTLTRSSCDVYYVTCLYQCSFLHLYYHWYGYDKRIL